MRLIFALLALLPLPAAAVNNVGFSEMGGKVLVLQAEQSFCPAGMRRAIVFEQAKTFVGCWEVKDGFVLLAWEDGDAGRISVNRIRWTDGRTTS